MRRALLILSISVACAALAQAFSFEPITQDFGTTGPSANRVFRVHNNTEERIAVKISVRPRRIEPDGSEIQGKESEEFTIYPRQMLLEPDERRSVRVRWSGSAGIESELPYRIIAEQLPVDFGEERPAEGASIRLTYRYEGSIYVVPPGVSPDVRVNSVVAESGEGGLQLTIEVQNHGTRHVLLNNLSISLRASEDGEALIRLPAEDLPGLTGENMLAGTVRRVPIPAPPGLWDGPIYGDMEYGPE